VAPSQQQPKDQKMIKIEFPSDRKDIALAIGRALTTIGQNNDRAPDNRTAEAKTEERAELYQHNPEPEAGVTEMRGDSHGLYEHVGKTEEAIKVGDIEQAIKEVLPEERRAVGQSDGLMGDHLGDTHPRVDLNFVRFDEKYCGEAAIPLYASGKQKGQWKKRKGLEESVYDEWYAEQLGQKMAPEVKERDEPEPNANSTANAFKKSPVVEENAPKNFGELMAWFASQQAAGNYDAHHLEAAFKTLKLSTLDLVQDTTGEKIAQVYEYLA
jgi:hypothetical protein